MSYPQYPEQVYHREEGDVSAVFRSAGTPPDLGAAGGDAIHYLATKASTQGEFGLYRVEMSPHAGGPGTHFHKTVSESFYVLDGTVRLFDGTDWVDAEKGDCLYVPQGGLHAFRNDSDAPAEMLMIFAPGALREEYFEGLAALADASDEERTEFFVRHDSYFVE